MASYWSPDRTRRLHELLTDEVRRSASMIADVLNSGRADFISRCAVIGKIHREGWTALLRNKGARRDYAAPTTNGQDFRLRKPLWKPQAPRRRELETPVMQRRALVELTAATCHWPIGDPREPGFFFCGADAIDECPYCAAHRRKAYAKLSKPRRGVS